MTGLGNDVRFAVRSLLRAPGFLVVAVLTLSLGIGANTAVFTLVDGALLRPLPYPEPDRLVSLKHTDLQDPLPLSPGLYLLYRDRANTLESVGLYAPTAANLVVEGRSERVSGQAVTPDFFEVLGISAARGRTFVASEGRTGGSPVVLLSDGLWRSGFGADPAVVGRVVDMNGVSREVVGVMPPRFGFPDRTARYWIPLMVDPASAPLAAFFPDGIARMSTGRHLEDVQAELAGLLTQLDRLYPGDRGAGLLGELGVRPLVHPLRTAVVGDVGDALWIVLGMVGFVLLIACANVANLLLVRAEGRHRDIALRLALGASRARVLRASLVESMALATIGGVGGTLVASATLGVTSHLIPARLARVVETGVDIRALFFTALLVVGCSILFGLLPALRSFHGEVGGALREGGDGRISAAGPARQRLRSGLVVSQVALALVLLVGSGLLVRTFLALRSVDPGFDTRGILTARVFVPSGEIEDPRETADFFERLGQRLSGLPGVSEVGFTTNLPLGGEPPNFRSVELEDHPRNPDDLPVFAALPQADAGYVEAMGIAVIEGRSLRPEDRGDRDRGVLVSRAFAETWWPERGAVGRRLRYGAPDEDWYTIVGVVEDVHEGALEETPRASVYFPTLQESAGWFFVARLRDVVIRTEVDPLLLVPVLRRELAALNPRIPLAGPRTMERVLAGSTARTSFTLVVLGAASTVALLLGLVGIYGVLSYMVSQRVREIGLRMALGASGSGIRGMVLRRGLLLVSGGIGLGFLGSLALSRMMSAVLFGVSPVDPLTYGVVAGALVLVALAACWIPAGRAAATDPGRALRV